MSSRNSLLQLSRKVHLYLGLFISPALLFFAFTGAYQTLGLHEPSSNYKPVGLLASLGQIHKKQTYLVPVRRPAAQGPEGNHNEARSFDQGHAPTVPANSGQGDRSQGGGRHSGRDNAAVQPAAAGTNRPSDDAGPSRQGNGQAPLTLQAKQKQHLPLKLFFVLVGLGLFISTLTGIYMAYKYDRNKLLVTALLVAGVLIPLVLLRF